MAKQFSTSLLVQSMTSATRPVPRDRTTIAGIRAQLAEDFTPRAQRARERWPVRIERETLNGIRCQIVTPAVEEPERDVLYFFGGGYVSGCPEFELPVTAALSTLTRARIIVPEYSLAPEYPFPRAFHECFCLYRSLAQEGGQGIVVAGESAGGGLAMAVTRAAMAGGIRPPEKLVLFSPWADLTEDGINACEEITDPKLTVSELHLFKTAYLSQFGKGSALASPALKPIPTAWPKTFLSTATNDLLRASVKGLHRRLELAGVQVEFRDECGLWHAFELYDDLPEAARSLEYAGRFISRDRELPHV